MKLQAEEVCLIYDVPPWLLGFWEKTWLNRLRWQWMRMRFRLKRFF